MKSILFLLFILPFSLSAQMRELKVTVLNKQNKPVKSVKMETFPTKQKASTDKEGVCTFINLTDKDSLLISFPGSSLSAAFSVAGLKELQFNTSKTELVAFDPITNSWVSGKGRKVFRKGEFNVDNEIANGANNLEDLLKRMPGLMVTGGTISLRNPVQTKEFSNTAPLIVVDGIAIRGGLSEANRTVNIHEIESIEIERDGTLWGRDAVNGAIIIKLKR